MRKYELSHRFAGSERKAVGVMPPAGALDGDRDAGSRAGRLPGLARLPAGSVPRRRFFFCHCDGHKTCLMIGFHIVASNNLICYVLRCEYAEV